MRVHCQCMGSSWKARTLQVPLCSARSMGSAAHVLAIPCASRHPVKLDGMHYVNRAEGRRMHVGTSSAISTPSSLVAVVASAEMRAAC